MYPQWYKLILKYFHRCDVHNIKIKCGLAFLARSTSNLGSKLLSISFVIWSLADIASSAIFSASVINFSLRRTSLTRIFFSTTLNFLNDQIIRLGIGEKSSLLKSGTMNSTYNLKLIRSMNSFHSWKEVYCIGVTLPPILVRFCFSSFDVHFIDFLNITFPGKMIWS